MKKASSYQSKKAEEKQKKDEIKNQIDSKTSNINEMGMSFAKKDRKSTEEKKVSSEDLSEPTNPTTKLDWRDKDT